MSDEDVLTPRMLFETLDDLTQSWGDYRVPPITESADEITATEFMQAINAFQLEISRSDEKLRDECNQISILLESQKDSSISLPVTRMIVLEFLQRAEYYLDRNWKMAPFEEQMQSILTDLQNPEPQNTIPYDERHLWVRFQSPTRWSAWMELAAQASVSNATLRDMLQSVFNKITEVHGSFRAFEQAEVDKLLPHGVSRWWTQAHGPMWEQHCDTHGDPEIALRDLDAGNEDWQSTVTELVNTVEDYVSFRGVTTEIATRNRMVWSIAMLHRVFINGFK